MKDDKTAMLRLPAFVIDFTLIMATIIGFMILAKHLGVGSKVFEAELVMFVWIPLGFFIYWSLGINLGKRLFRLRIVDADSGQAPSVFQYFRRCLIFSLLISMNIIFLIPLFVSKRNQGFQDMLANTLVVRSGHRIGESP